MKIYISASSDYNSYSVRTIGKLFDIGRQLRKENKDIDNYYDEWEDRVSDIVRFVGPDELELVGFAYDNPSIKAEEREYYRIGEPQLNMGGYYSKSHNFANDTPESGVSVITSKWLNSVKSIFFGAHDDDVLKSKGVYKIKGILVGYGGDDEPVIYPTDYAYRTNITTYEELEQAVKQSGF